LKYEIIWKSATIPSNLLVQAVRRYAIELRKIGVEDDLLPAYQQDSFGNVLY